MAHDRKESVRERVARFRAKQKLAILRVLEDPLVPYLKLGMSEEEAIKAYQADEEARHRAAVDTALLAMQWNGADSMVVKDADGKIIGRLKREPGAPKDGHGSEKEWNEFLAKYGFSLTAGDTMTWSKIKPILLGNTLPDSDLVKADDEITSREQTTGGGRRVVPKGVGPDS